MSWRSSSGYTRQGIVLLVIVVVILIAIWIHPHATEHFFTHLGHAIKHFFAHL